MSKEKYLKNKLTNMCNTYKSIATLSKLAIEQKNFELTEFQYLELKKIEARIIDIINKIFPQNRIHSLENLYSETLPEYYIALNTISAYNKMLSLKYTNLIEKLEDSETEKIIKLCKMAIDFNFKEDFAYIKLCKTLYSCGKYAEVIKLSEYIRSITDTAPVYEILGDTYRALGDYGSAIECYHKYLERNEKDDKAMETLEEIYKDSLIA